MVVEVEIKPVEVPRSWIRVVLDWLQANGVWAYAVGMLSVAAFQYFRDNDFSRQELIHQAIVGVMGLVFFSWLALDRIPTVPDRVVRKRLRELFQFGGLPEVDQVYEALRGGGLGVEKYRKATDRYFLAQGDAVAYRAWMAKELGV